MLKTILFLTVLLIIQLYSQDFIESVEDDNESDVSANLNGFVRGAFFAGKKVSEDKLEQKSGYGELGLKLRVRKGRWGDGYGEVRLVQGRQFDEAYNDIWLREGYVNIYLGNFDIRAGQQIVVWGRADGINPTNNITPRNILIFSTDEDDQRLSNFLFRVHYNFNPFRFEGIYVPVYRSSELPTFLFPLEDYVEIGDQDNPDASLSNGSFALKLDMTVSAFEGSVSYFKGFMPLPGISLQSISTENGLNVVIANKPYKMEVTGLDFAFTLGSYGLRGEIAYRHPTEDYSLDENVYIPNPDVQYVLGLDKSIGDFSLILQYVGRYIADFKEFKETGFPTDQLYIYNRMISYQLNEQSHAIFFRPSITLLHEILDMDLIAYYDFTTRENLVRFLISYDISDGLLAKIGVENYSGPVNTLLGTIDKALSSGFVELRVSF
jgi:hypothetical protein